MTNPFHNIDFKDREKLLKSLESHSFHFPKNNSIFSIFEQENHIGIILNGYLQIVRIDSNGNRIIMEEIGENEIFGSFMLSFKSAEYEILAKEDTDIVVLEYDQILHHQDLNKKYYFQFLQNMLEISFQKMKEKNERIEILTKKTIRNKLLEYFNIISSKYGSKYVYLPFNFTDLADYLAIDRSAMSRELKNLKEEGLIEVKGKRITLLYDKFSSIYKMIHPY